MVNADDPASLVMPISGRFAGGAHYFPARVYFEDTDAGGVVYHANYLRFMERGRSDMLRLAGIDQRASLDGGEGVYAVTRVEIDYRGPARLEDDLVIESRVAEVRAASCIIDQKIRRGPELLIQARVIVAFLSPEGRPKRQPPRWIELFNHIAQGKDLSA